MYWPRLLVLTVVSYNSFAPVCTHASVYLTDVTPILVARCRFCSYGTRDRVQLQKHYKAHGEAKKICK